MELNPKTTYTFNLESESVQLRTKYISFEFKSNIDSVKFEGNDESASSSDSQESIS